ncbi:MAG: hypothetical protein LBN95_02420 [Prevotellaceae bacterium]|nr:hypothetical protein [Prevotellaceae bacterium]
MRWAEITIGFQPKGYTKIANYDCCLKGKYNLAQCGALGEQKQKKQFKNSKI